jgi:hypothetical protein
LTGDKRYQADFPGFQRGSVGPIPDGFDGLVSDGQIGGCGGNLKSKDEDQISHRKFRMPATRGGLR